MRTKRFCPLTGALGLIVLAGCATTKVPTDIDTTGMPNPEIALRDSFQKVDTEMASLGAMAPPRLDGAREPVMPAELEKIVTFSWHGPLDDGVRKLADSIGYSVTVTAPDKPVALPVKFSTGPEQVFQILRELGEAAGTTATVQLDPLNHRIQVIHHA